MKKSLITVSVLVLAALVGAKAGAQQFQSGFFLDNYSYSYRYNPALMSEKGFISLGTGDLNVGLRSNVGVNNLLFPNQAGDGLVTGLHSSVPLDKFPGGLADITNIGIDLNENILGLAFRSENTQTNIEINLRSNTDLNLPKDLFTFAKSGTGSNGGKFDLSDFGVSNREYVEIAVGRARRILDGHLVYGYRLKGLLGAANVNVGFDKADLQINGAGIAVDVAASGKISCPAVDLTKCNTPDGPDFNRIEIVSSGFSPTSFGWALDLGVCGKFFDDCITVSAGFLDLGQIYWNYNTTVSSGANAAFYGLEDIGIGTDFEKTGEQFTSLGEDLSKIADLNFETAQLKETENLPWTLNLGTRLRIPFVKRISFSGLYTYHNGISPWYDARVAATLTPFNWFSLTANTGTSTFGGVCGGALSLNLIGFNIHAGVDCYRGSVGKYNNIPFPISAFRYCVNFGLTWQLPWKRHSEFTSRKK